MKWGVRGALLTSDHFAAPGQLKLRFSAARPGPVTQRAGSDAAGLAGPGYRFDAKAFGAIGRVLLAAECAYVLAAVVAQRKGSCCI